MSWELFLRLRISLRTVLLNYSNDNNIKPIELWLKDNKHHLTSGNLLESLLQNLIITHIEGDSAKTLLDCYEIECIKKATTQLIDSPNLIRDSTLIISIVKAFLSKYFGAINHTFCNEITHSPIHKLVEFLDLSFAECTLFDEKTLQQKYESIWPLLEDMLPQYEKLFLIMKNLTIDDLQSICPTFLYLQFKVEVQESIDPLIKEIIQNCAISSNRNQRLVPLVHYLSI